MIAYELYFYMKYILFSLFGFKTKTFQKDLCIIYLAEIFQSLSNM